MRLQKMDKNKHGSFRVSELIYEADAETFDFFFGNQENASEKLGKLVEVGDNHLGYQQIYVVTNDDQEIVGVMVYCTGDKMGNIHKLKVLFANFNLLDSLRFIMIEIIDSLFLSSLEEDDFYYAIIAVDENARGQGIGSFILEEGIKLAREKGCKRAVLDVDIKNEGALRLYERFGFRKFKEKSLSFLGWKKGAFNMGYIL
jgi:ribosomal protein S18 acetylase RimI-like enzyme